MLTFKETAFRKVACHCTPPLQPYYSCQHPPPPTYLEAALDYGRPQYQLGGNHADNQAQAKEQAGHVAPQLPGGVLRGREERRKNNILKTHHDDIQMVHAGSDSDNDSYMYHLHICTTSLVPTGIQNGIQYGGAVPYTG